MSQWPVGWHVRQATRKALAARRRESCGEETNLGDLRRRKVRRLQGKPERIQRRRTPRKHHHDWPHARACCSFPIRSSSAVGKLTRCVRIRRRTIAERVDRHQRWARVPWHCSCGMCGRRASAIDDRAFAVDGRAFAAVRHVSTCSFHCVLHDTIQIRPGIKLRYKCSTHPWTTG